MVCDNNASLHVIKMMLEAYPNAAQVQINFGDLPLHWEIRSNTSYEIIAILLESYPEAVRVQDNCGDLPFHYAWYQH
jgi:enoyl reductase-like protein